MHSISRHGQQNLIAQYRDARLRHATLAGIACPSFRCRRCRKYQGVSGRRQVVRGTSMCGYCCAHWAALAGR